jgi:hypothetical protein
MVLTDRMTAHNFPQFRAEKNDFSKFRINPKKNNVIILKKQIKYFDRYIEVWNKIRCIAIGGRNPYFSPLSHN